MNLKFGPRMGTRTALLLSDEGDEIVPTPPLTTTLSVAIGESVDPVITVVNFGMLVTTGNLGAIDATGVVVTVTLDASLAYVSSVGTGWSTGAIGQIVTCTRATMAPGGAPTITITCTSGTAALTATTTVTAIAANATIVNDSEDTTVKLVDRDATSGRRMPSSVTQWNSLNAYNVAIGTLNFVAKVPTHGYGCQEASGNLIDQIGSMNLAAAGTPLYQQAVAGQTNKGVGFNEGVNQRFSVGSGTGPNPTLTPVATLTYFTGRTPAAMRGMVLLSDAGAASRSAMLFATTGFLRTQCAATTNDGIVDHRDSAMHAGLLTYDLAGTTTNRYSDLEKDTGTFAAGVLDGTKGLGAVGGQNSHLGEVVRHWIFEGTDAQHTDASAKALLQALEWAPGWT